MNNVVVVDANLIVLLVVGSAAKEYIHIHKRLSGYTADDFEMLCLIIEQFSDIVLLPHILSEASNLVRQISNPARQNIQEKLKILIETNAEIPISSICGANNQWFYEFGLTDAVILHLFNIQVNGIIPTLVTTDSRLSNIASSLGYSVINYDEEYKSR